LADNENALSRNFAAIYDFPDVPGFMRRA